MKAKVALLIIFLLWFGDFFTTSIALNVLDGFTETNLLKSQYFELGTRGWITATLIDILALSGVVFVCYLICLYIKNKTKKDVSLPVYISLIVISSYIYIPAIINNSVQILLKLIFK